MLDYFQINCGIYFHRPHVHFVCLWGMASTNVKLDDVLKSFNNQEGYLCWSDIFSSDFIARSTVKPYELKLILEFLTEEGFLRIENMQHPVYGIIPHYKLRYKGYVFMENGGYQSAAAETQSRIKYEKLKDRLLIAGSWGAMIGAIGICLIELMKYWKWASSINFFSMAYLLISGILIGIAIFLVGSEVSQRIRNRKS